MLGGVADGLLMQVQSGASLNVVQSTRAAGGNWEYYLRKSKNKINMNVGAAPIAVPIHVMTTCHLHKPPKAVALPPTPTPTVGPTSSLAPWQNQRGAGQHIQLVNGVPTFVVVTESSSAATNGLPTPAPTPTNWAASLSGELGSEVCVQDGFMIVGFRRIVGRLVCMHRASATYTPVEVNET